MDKRLFFAAIVCAMLPQPVAADTRDEVWAAMQRCQAIRDDRAWLDCNYGAQQPMRARLGLAPAPDFQQRLVPPASMPLAVTPPPVMPSASAAPVRNAPAALSHRKPSFFQVLTGTAPPLAVSALASVQYDSQGAFIVTLENGQVWHQIDADFSTKPKFKIGVKATVTPGALGSYHLKTNDSSRVYKVERRS